MGGLVSIIVPVYNAAPYIAKTIEMVRQQTYDNWELILVNDDSKDNSLQEIEKSLDGYDRYREEGDQPDIVWVDVYTMVHIGTIRVISKPHNEGAAKARNTGLSVATGRYIAFLDADDVWLPDKLSKELSFMEVHGTQDHTSEWLGDPEYIRTDWYTFPRLRTDISSIRWKQSVWVMW